MKESDVYRQIVSQVCYVNSLSEIAAGRSLLVKFKKKKEALLNTKQNFDFFLFQPYYYLREETGSCTGTYGNHNNSPLSFKWV